MESNGARSADEAVVRPTGGRRASGKRRFINIPGLARRGRTTVRHFTLLLLGGYISWIRDQRRRGARGWFFKLRAAPARFFRLFVGPDFVDQPFPVQLRRRLEILGPTYVKLGQILSLRLDILPEVVTEELRNLLSRLPPVPFEAIVEVVEEDLARPLDSAFAFVDPAPLGSASIAQSHRARLHNDEQVLLKVVKPGIRELLYRDTTLLRGLGVILQFLIPRYQPHRIIDEFCEYTLLEVDMAREADNAETFVSNFADIPDIVFPAVFREFSGEQVLCMQYLHGEEPDAETVQALSRDERRHLIDLGAEAVIRMVYEDGFFHADLHPGNLLILPGNKIGFIDLGMVGRLDPALRHNLLYMFYSLVIEDYEGASRHISDVAQIDPRSDVPAFRRAVKELCRRWRRNATFENFSVALLILEATRLGARYRMYFPVEMVLMVKALVTYEGVGYMLDKDFNVAEVSQRHVGRIFRHRFSPGHLLREGVRIAPDLVEAVSRMPILVSESLRFLEQRTRRVPEAPLRGTRATLFGGFCLVAGAILVAFDGPWPLWVALLIIGILLPLRRGN
jgi:ubiquinone biosynthesis protein